jgi:hypothetical protein
MLEAPMKSAMHQFFRHEKFSGQAFGSFAFLPSAYTLAVIASFNSGLSENGQCFRVFRVPFPVDGMRPPAL